jgi:hypothetical protein
LVANWLIFYGFSSFLIFGSMVGVMTVELIVAVECLARFSPVSASSAAGTDPRKNLPTHHPVIVPTSRIAFSRGRKE